MFLLHKSSHALTPSGTYIQVNNLKPGVPILDGAGGRSYVKRVRKILHYRDDLLASLSIQQWHSPYVGPRNQHVLTTHGWKELCNIDISKHMTLFPSVSNWTIPDNIRIHLNGQVIEGRFALGYIFGAAYICFDNETNVLRTGDEHLYNKLKQCFEAILISGFICDNKYKSIQVNNELRTLFATDQNTQIPRMLRCKDPQYSYGMFRGIIDTVCVQHHVHQKVFETAFLTVLLSKNYQECNIHTQQDHLLFNVKEVQKVHSNSAPLFLVELTNTSKQSILANNVIIKSII